nr:hypothetical protein OH820_17735 [Streptomyces sp. NBC_00857]
MIKVKVSEDGRRILLDAPEVAVVVVSAVAAEHAEDSPGIVAILEEVDRRRRTWEGLAGLAEVQDLPEHVVDGAVAAYDELRQAFVDCFAEPITYPLSDEEARRLAVELWLAAAVRLRDGGAR